MKKEIVKHLKEDIKNYKHETMKDKKLIKKIKTVKCSPSKKK
jgi:hypothetical protein